VCERTREKAPVHFRKVRREGGREGGSQRGRDEREGGTRKRARAWAGGRGRGRQSEGEGARAHRDESDKEKVNARQKILKSREKRRRQCREIVRQQAKVKKRGDMQASALMVVV